MPLEPQAWLARNAKQQLHNMEIIYWSCSWLRLFLGLEKSWNGNGDLGFDQPLSQGYRHRRWRSSHARNFETVLTVILKDRSIDAGMTITDQVEIERLEEQASNLRKELEKKNVHIKLLIDQIRDELQGPKKRPRIKPGEEIDEKSKKVPQFCKFEGRIAFGDSRVRTQQQNSLARLEGKDAAAKAAAKREEERVAELKKMRGERWLPCIAKEKRHNVNTRT